MAMARPTKSPDEVQTEQIGVRLTSSEAGQLDVAISTAEQAAGLMPGSISRGSFIRSVLLRHLQMAAPMVAKEQPTADRAQAVATMRPAGVVPPPSRLRPQEMSPRQRATINNRRT